MNMDFSSWPRDQEATFVVYEQRSQESQKKALVMGIASAIFVFVAALGIYAGVEPDKRDLSKDMNMSNLTKKARVPAPAATPAPEAAKPETPKPETPPAEK